MKALVSVSDKTGVVDLARRLTNMGYEIISSGGTCKLIRDNGIEVVEVSDYTGFPECFDGRIKTLHPKIEGGILFQRSNKEHVKHAKEIGIAPIDIVVCNLYPFREKYNSKSTHEEIIENIDIGGPTMLRAAAKNYVDIAVVTEPKDYELILSELEEKGGVSLDTKTKLARQVFNHTAQYDAMIANYFNEKAGISYPEQLTLTFDKKQDLRYGENPHQTAAFYQQVREDVGLLSDAEQLHGKELSYNNISDANGGLETLREFSSPTVVAVKHGTACGVGSADTILEAYKKAYEADPISIFGGILLSNEILDLPTAELISKVFMEVVIAPDYEPKALEVLTKKKNVRILKLSNISAVSKKSFVGKTVSGGLLVQSADLSLFEDAELEVVTKHTPDEKQMKDLVFAMKLVKHAKSNGIVIAKDEKSLGIGTGQVSRIGSLNIAVGQAGEQAQNAVLASDAFFPFSDCVEAAHDAGITAIIQPGGSVKDQDSIDAANRLGIAMVFTKQRHFKH